MISQNISQSEPQPWDQRPDEPAKWYGRFLLYLGLGPTRTAVGARREYYRKENRPVARASNANWGYYANRWQWAERARAWDIYQLHLLGASERNARNALHHRRVDVMEDYLEQVRAALDAANLAELTQEQARKLLPQIRDFLVDLLVVERTETERWRDEDSPVPPITADDLRAAQRTLEQAAPAPVETQERARYVEVNPAMIGRILYVCQGVDPTLGIDLPALNDLRAATGLKHHRLLNATRRKFAEFLNRERSLGRPVELLHLALPSSAQGIEFVDESVPGHWLRDRLTSVHTLLLPAYAGDRRGDWLETVPFVVTLNDTLDPAVARTFAQQFWSNIGLRLEPGPALEQALAVCPLARGSVTCYRPA